VHRRAIGSNEKAAADLQQRLDGVGRHIAESSGACQNGNLPKKADDKISRQKNEYG
jgi:hypothetical protein